jgi:hypothetical protein
MSYFTRLFVISAFILAAASCHSDQVSEGRQEIKIDPNQVLVDFAVKHLAATADIATTLLPNNAQPKIELSGVMNCLGVHSNHGGVSFPGAEPHEGIVGTCIFNGNLGASSTQSIFAVVYGAPIVTNAPHGIENTNVSVESVVLLEVEEL